MTKGENIAVRNDKRDAGEVYCLIKHIIIYNINYLISINNIYTLFNQKLCIKAHKLIDKMINW